MLTFTGSAASPEVGMLKGTLKNIWETALLTETRLLSHAVPHHVVSSTDHRKTPSDWIVQKSTQGRKRDIWRQTSARVQAALHLPAKQGCYTSPGQHSTQRGGDNSLLERHTAASENPSGHLQKAANGGHVPVFYLWPLQRMIVISC